MASPRQAGHPPSGRHHVRSETATRGSGSTVAVVYGMASGRTRDAPRACLKDRPVQIGRKLSSGTYGEYANAAISNIRIYPTALPPPTPRPSATPPRSSSSAEPLAQIEVAAQPHAGLSRIRGRAVGGRDRPPTGERRLEGKRRRVVSRRHVHDQQTRLRHVHILNRFHARSTPGRPSRFLRDGCFTRTGAGAEALTPHKCGNEHTSLPAGVR